MKKRGFTLIELLAVIVILAIISIIAIPLIASVVEKAKEGAARDGGYNYIRAVETGIAANKLDSSKPDIIDGIYSVSDLKNTYKVEVKGKGPTDGEVTIEKGKITECSLTIEGYNFICEGNELVLGEVKLPEHRMRDSYYHGSFYDNESLAAFILGRFNIDIYSDDVNNLTEEQLNEIMNIVSELAGKENTKSQLTYFLPDEIVPNEFNTLTLSEDINESHQQIQNALSSINRIEKVLTVRTNIVPNNAIASKDISANNDGSVMVWYLDQDNDSKYEMYIGQNGGVIAPEDCTKLFEGISYISADNLEMDLSNMITSYTKYMSGMFENLQNLTSLDLTGWNTWRVKSMSAMFSYCRHLTSLDVGHFNTRNVTNMGSMFQGCESLIELDLRNFDTSKVKDMSYMFAWCKNLTNLNVSHFNTSSAKDMQYMFFELSLTSLDLSYFDTQNVINMHAMFGACKSLTTLDLSSFDTRNVTDYYGMFYWDSNLTTIYVGPNWIINSGADTGYMFDSCGTSTVTLQS